MRWKEPRRAGTEPSGQQPGAVSFPSSRGTGGAVVGPGTECSSSVQPWLVVSCFVPGDPFSVSFSVCLSYKE